MKNLGFIILIICLFSFACEPEEEYSEIPVVKYKDFNFEIENINGFVNQVGLLSFDFIDGKILKKMQFLSGRQENFRKSISQKLIIIIYMQLKVRQKKLFLNF